MFSVLFIGRIFFLQKVHQPIVEGVRRFVRPCEFRELVAGYGTPPVAIKESFGAMEVL